MRCKLCSSFVDNWRRCGLEPSYQQPHSRNVTECSCASPMESGSDPSGVAIRQTCSNTECSKRPQMCPWRSALLPSRRQHTFPRSRLATLRELMFGVGRKVATSGGHQDKSTSPNGAFGSRSQQRKVTSGSRENSAKRF